MCDVVTALKIGTAIYAHQSKRALAKGQMKANEQTRRNSDQAYLNDISKIDREAVSASREKAIAKFKISSSPLVAFIFDKFFSMLEVSDINSSSF